MSADKYETYISILLGQTITEIIGGEKGDESITFKTADRQFEMYHEFDCCEQVSVEDIIGDLSDLIGSPITMAEVVSNEDELEYGSCTWTFYKLATINGYVTIRWYGESNGCYSEEVTFAEILSR